MERKTLQECISFFNANELMRPAAVRAMEELGEWKTAKEYWAKLGRQDDVAACQMIINATAKGDAYRDSVKHLNQWVDETVESGIMTKDEAIKVVSPEMQRIYNNHFR